MSEELSTPSVAKKDLPIGVRVLLRVLCVLLCLCLCASVTATVLILDFRLVTSKDITRQIAGAMFSLCAPARHLPVSAAAGAMPSAEVPEANAQTQQELVGWLYDTLKKQHGEELKVTQEQMQTFLDQSTTKEYLTEKVASYMDDFINGTDTTTITPEELEWLIDENNAAIEGQLGVQMDDAARQQVLSFAEEMNIGEVIRTEVIEKVENITISGDATDPASGYTVKTLMEDLRTYTSVTALIVSILVNLLLMAAMFFCNRMRLSGTLCSVGIPLTLVGALLTLAAGVLQLIPSLLPSAVANAALVVVRTIAPVHYAVLGLGIAALIGAIVAKVLSKK